MLRFNERAQEILEGIGFLTPAQWIEEFYKEEESEDAEDASASAGADTTGISSFNQLCQLLKERMSFSPTDFVASFSEHGVVLVFDPAMVDAFLGERKNPTLVNNLGFSVIDSSFASPFTADFHPPYIRCSNTQFNSI